MHVNAIKISTRKTQDCGVNGPKKDIIAKVSFNMGGGIKKIKMQGNQAIPRTIHRREKKNPRSIAALNLIKKLQA